MMRDDSLNVGDTLSVSTWGRLAPAAIARHGISNLAGMISAYHTNCDEPNHFWCAPPQLRVFAMAEFYQPGNPEGERYIGCYLRGADFDDDGVPTIHEAPSLKALMQPMDDGHVFVQFGRITDRGKSNSVAGLGMLDRGTSEYLLVTPRSVPDVPQEIGNSITFVIQRFRNAWHIAHFLHDDEFPTNAQARVFASLPVSPQPSPLTRIVIDNDPLR